ncbi:Gp17 [Mycolicibacterium canariasense]|uniref:Gp17 n=1 Tax=Mycolicibacterium canariasense TaxID=228230 RepID=A0A100W9M2_MYCCR|nr:hypothetical protein [Mycolicibacterium canariasense]ORV07150.1 hypothetical protein AWB94_14215 [Mycolicibacterium canariasense]GAS94432.1 Gp17 [Mycolicibacterium canariasense]
MSSDAARLEALGEPVARFRWRNHELEIPRPLEEWPLEAIRNGHYVDAAVTLLAGQTAPIPLYGDVMDLADAMAAAVGVERLPESKVDPDNRFGTFGAVPLLLSFLDDYEDDVASDLKTYRNVDYLDRWRGDLTLRQIWVYIRRLPSDSSLARACNGGHELWTKQHILTAQVWEQLARQVYVGRPMTKEELDAALAKKRENEQTMAKLAAKEDYWSPAASLARREAAEAKKRAIATAVAASPVAAGRLDEPPAAAMSALDKAMATRRRDLTHTPRKAG